MDIRLLVVAFLGCAFMSGASRTGVKAALNLHQARKQLPAKGSNPFISGQSVVEKRMGFPAGTKMDVGEQGKILQS